MIYKLSFHLVFGSAEMVMAAPLSMHLLLLLLNCTVCQRCNILSVFIPKILLKFFPFINTYALNLHRKQG